MASKRSVSEAFETDAPSRELSAGLAIATTFLCPYDGQRRLLGLLGHLQIIIIVRLLITPIRFNLTGGISRAVHPLAGVGCSTVWKALGIKLIGQ
ncbi:hypothetical protein SDJN02_07641, partial [Cucurbita argyrosperma subsp. argyrosperma]